MPLTHEDSNRIFLQLKTDGFDNQEATMLHAYLGLMYSYIQNNPSLQKELLDYKKAFSDTKDVWNGVKAVLRADRYRGIGKLVIDQGKSGGLSILNVFIDRFAVLAKDQGLELNECALSIAKLAADIGELVY